MKQTFFIIFSVAALVLAFPVSIFAHAVVRPSEVKVAQYQTFTLGVPNEKDNPTVSVRVIVPEGVASVTPNVKPGWKISVNKTGEGESAVVREVIWSGGLIPAGQRDEFLFSAKTPSSAQTISWKVYQTYQNGITVSWDKEESSDVEGEASGPASHTKVVNDLAASPTPTPVPTVGQSNGTTNVLAIAALLISAITGYKVFSQQK